ncbi:hypothetical protein EBR43_10825 [bacterium]|nr:hypothetical protein [bacterium]
MKIRLKLANQVIPFKITNFDIDFEDRLGKFTAYIDLSIDAVNKKAGKALLEREVDYPYILSHAKLVYKLLEDHLNLWLTAAPSSTGGLFHYIMLRFRQMYEKGNNTGGFEIKKTSKWRISSLSFTGLSLDGDPSNYDVYFGNNIVKLKVFGEFALREVEK